METARTQSMIAAKYGSYVVYVHTQDSPTDDEWNLVLQFYRVADKDALRTLVYSEGAAPNASQRARLRELLGGRRVAMAVMTPSVFVRAAGTAIGWFNPSYRVFGAREFDAAFDHLGATREERSELRVLVEKLKAELGIAAVVSSHPSG